MTADEGRTLMSVKTGYARNPAVIAAGAASMLALLALNVVAFARGWESPWLLGGVIAADLLTIGTGIIVAVRGVLRAEHRTEISEARLDIIVDSAMDAIITVDSARNIFVFNRAAEQMFRCPRAEAIGGPLDRFIPERFRAAHRGHIEHFGRTGVTSRRMGDVTTLWGLRADGEEFPIEASISQAGSAGERYFTVILRDVTRRKQVEAEARRIRGELDEAQARVAAIVDSAMDAVITVDDEQKIVLFNRAAEQVFGVRRETMLGAPLDRLLPARFRTDHSGHVEGFGRTGVTSRRMGDVTTLWALRPETGEEFPIEAAISQALEGGKRYFTVILRDITLRKQAEDALRESQRELRELSAQVQEAREEEKARIARELHDELGQLLTALQMELSWMRKRLPADPELDARADEMRALLERTVISTRRISADLRPLILDDLGLAEAAGALADEFGKRSGLTCRTEIADESELHAVSKAVAATVYRAIQESLTNIARHADARNAWIVIRMRSGVLEVEIEDDGRGIAPEDLKKARSSGLKGMRERIAFVGGSLDIARAPRGGTSVRLRVPVQGLGQERAA